MKFWLYSSASLAACVGLLWYTYVTRQQFYPSVIYLVTSKVSVLVLGNAGLVLTTLFGRVLKSFFLGTLRDAEVELLHENVRYAVTETCLALTIFRDEISFHVMVLFTALVFLKIFHWLSQARIEFIEQTDIISTKMSDVEMKSAEDVPAFEGISSRNRSTESWPWVEKYRPSSLDDLIAHQEIISTLNRLIDAQKLPHLLFYGPPGTGKTSMIIAAARRLYGKNYGSMVLELNASDDRGIDVVRNQIKEFAGTKKLFSQGVKLIILDEADSMTNDAQFSLRRVIEKYTKNARFCLICNYVSKIIPALQSRCTRFRFAPLNENQVSGRVKHIAQLEKLNMTEDGFKAILRLGQGDMRRILNILQATSMAHDVVNEANVYLCTGNPLPKDIASVTQWLFNENFATAVQKCAEMQKLKGYATSDILQDVYHYTTELELSPRCRMYLYDELAKLEHRLSNGTTEELQLASLVAVFAIAREQMSNAVAATS